MSLEKNKRIRGGRLAFVTKLIQTANEVLFTFNRSQSRKDLLIGYKLTLTDKKESLKKLDESILNEIEDETKLLRKYLIRVKWESQLIELLLELIVHLN